VSTHGISTIRVTDRAKLSIPGPSLFAFRPASVLLALCAASGCAAGSAERASGVYGRHSRVLLRIDYDGDGDGRIDLRTYMGGGRPVRVEADTNGDDVIDRWEYYDARGEVLRIGGSTQGDGREDMWVRVRGAARTVDISSTRDGRIDRRETYDGNVLVRTESDTDGDGVPDRWEEFEGGALARLLLDDEHRGRPTRRVVYGGEPVRVETDLDGDGVWESGGGDR
jgi:hypothetical protein